MGNNISAFFIPDNEVRLPEELDYSSVDTVIRAAEAFSRSTYQSVYIIDYNRRNFLYVSPNPTFLCGLTREQVQELGYRFYLEYVPADEQELLLDINRAGFAFLNTIPECERSEWYIQYDFHIMNGKQRMLVNHKLTPLVLTTDGRVWLALCVVSASAHTSAGHIELHRADSPDYYEYNRVTRRWSKRRIPSLTDGEKTVISLSIQGLTMAEIADKMCLSPDTVKKYRRQIFEKLEVRNIPEAIVAATNSRLI